MNLGSEMIAITGTPEREAIPCTRACEQGVVAISGPAVTTSRELIGSSVVVTRGPTAGDGGGVDAEEVT